MSVEFKLKMHDMLRRGRDLSAYHKGIPYRYFLQLLHEIIAPECYFEIGIDEGRTLSLARCSAIGVDPSLRRLKQKRGMFSILPIGVMFDQPARHLFEMTSDHFFATQDLPRLFPKGIDLSFLDGMHLFEFLLRDFLNTEQLARRDLVIVLHDCCPVNTETTEREHRPDARVDHRTKAMWTGDVWKLLPILHRYRPDLRQIVLDCPPTGLVLLTDLNPHSTVLRENYQDIVEQFMRVTLSDYSLDRFRAEFAPLDSRSLFNGQALRGLMGRA